MRQLSPQSVWLRIVSVVLIVFGSYSARACELFFVLNRTQTISYGESAEFILKNVDNLPVVWKLYTENGEVKKEGKGDETGMMQFDIPGRYYVVFKGTLIPGLKSHTGAHGERHDDIDTAYITVNAVRMTFHLDEVTLSAPIRRGVSTFGTVLNVPVSVQTYDHKPVKYTPMAVITAGVGTSIIATPIKQEPLLLPENTFVLTYSLNGVAAEPAYIIFDFEDIYGIAQSYYIAVNK